MRLAFDRLSAAASAVRSSGQRMVLSALIFVSVVVLVLGKADLRLIRLTSDGLADGSLPILELARQPVAFTREAARRLGAVLAVYEENERLRAENEQLRAWQHRAVKLEVENDSLRELLSAPAIPDTRQFTSARVVADAASPFVHTRLIDRGRSSGLEAGMPAIRPEGLVGRILSVGERTARLMLLTDFNSHIPVIVGQAGEHAILVGDNSAEPKLRFLPLEPSIALGDAVITSGRGGLLPSGMMIGKVVRIDEAHVAVAPSIDWTRLDYVSILHHEPLARDRPGDHTLAAAP